MDYEQKYKEALERAKGVIEQNPLMEYLKKGIEYIFPELKESEDEKIRKWIIRTLKSLNNSSIQIDGAYEMMLPAIAWLEKQAERKTPQWMIDFLDNYRRKIGCSLDHDEARDVDGKILCIMQWLENQGTPAKLSEEEQNKFAKVVLRSCAMSFIDYLDAHKYEGKMCVSNGECEDIENAFHNAMWDRLHRYYCKYIEKQGEQKPAEWSEEDEKTLNSILTCIEHCQNEDIEARYNGNRYVDPKRYESMSDWLKSLRPQSQWKPSDEQIKVCKEVYADILSAKGFDLGTINGELNRLEEELKKLKG